MKFGRRLSRGDCFHLHADLEYTAFIAPSRLHSYLATSRFDNLFDHREAQADTFAADCNGRSRLLTKLSEQLRDFILSYSPASIFNMHN